MKLFKRGWNHKCGRLSCPRCHPQYRAPDVEPPTLPGASLREKVEAAADSEGDPLVCAEILDTAKGLVCGDRRASYGDATASFTRLAKLWSATLGTPVTAEQVSLCLIQLKVSRLVVSPDHSDSWVDICGYGALGGQVAARSRSAGDM